MNETQLLYPQWQELFVEAVMEKSSDVLLEKIQNAEKAISQRLRELGNDRRPTEERVALGDAASTLRNLKTVLMKSNDWKAQINRAN